MAQLSTSRVEVHIPRAKVSDEAVAIAACAHVEALYALTKGKPGEATTAQLIEAMRRALDAARGR